MRKMGIDPWRERGERHRADARRCKEGPLRYPDEFVRHKILDLIGDLALLGRRVLGRIVADRAGHAMHTAFVTRLLKDQSAWEETTVDAPQPDSIAPQPSVATL